MRTLTALLTLFVIALAADPALAGESVVVNKATLEGIGFLIVLGGLLGVIKLIITGKRIR